MVEPKFTTHDLQARYPQPGRFVIFLGLFLVITFQVCPGFRIRFCPVAMVSLIIQRHDALQAHQIGHDPLQHLSFRLQGMQRITSPSLQERPPAFRDLHPFTELKGMVICDDDLCPFEVREHVRGDNLSTLVIAIRVVRQENAQAVTDGQTRCHHQKTAGEFLTR